eukprot:11178556-Lingulodinium_polyedra.AAC.1
MPNRRPYKYVKCGVFRAPSSFLRPPPSARGPNARQRALLSVSSVGQGMRVALWVGHASAGVCSTVVSRQQCASPSVSREETLCSRRARSV